MTNSLIKKPVLEFVTQTVTDPGVPAVPGVPGHYETRTQQVCGLKYNTSGKYVAVTEETALGPVTKQIWVPDGGGGATSTWVCTTETYNMWVPAVPPIPAIPPRTYTVSVPVQGKNIGWNAGARSSKVVTGDFAAEFKVKQATLGAMVGMNGPDAGAGLYPGNNIDAAFLCQAGTARVYRSGSYVAPGGAYTDATVFRIERTGNTVVWKMDGSTVHTATIASLPAGMWLEASLYSADDEVFDPLLTQGTAPAAPDNPDGGPMALESLTLDLDLDFTLALDPGLRLDLDLDFSLIPQVETFTRLRLDLDLEFTIEPRAMVGQDPDEDGYEDDPDWGAGGGDGSGGTPGTGGDGSEGIGESVGSTPSGDAWAVNLDGFGSTAYAAFPFRSLANIGGRYFGCTGATLHELGGNRDAGAHIRAVIDLGERALAGGRKATLGDVFVGMAADGRMLLRVIAEGQAYVYPTLDYSEHMQQQRVKLGKGLDPNYVTLQLSNEQGADFAVDSLEFMVHQRSRRT